MGDKRRGGKRRADEETQKLSKEDDAIARLVRFNCPTKTTMFEGNEVHYFSGSKAVDVLFESKQYGHEAKEVKFSTRSSAVAMMRSLLEQGLFFRARKLVAKRKEDKRDKDKGEVEKSPKRKPKKEEKIEKEAKDRKEKKKEKAKDSDANDEDEEKEKKKDKDEDEKKKRKVKLELHQDQSFNDTNDVYVWIFDPTPLLKKIIGALMVLGTIVGCLFPLWPMWLRQGVYYMSLVALGCFGVLIGVAIARTILFALIWACTMGRHKLWLLPNLTEDCGFFESFKPWYTYEYVSDETASTKKKKKTDTKKTDDNDDKSDSKEKDGEEGEHKSEEESSNEKDQVHLREKKQRAQEESVDSEEGSASEEEDEQSSQGSGVSEDIEHNNTTEENKKPRRRARKDNDDFVLVEKQ